MRFSYVALLLCTFALGLRGQGILDAVVTRDGEFVRGLAAGDFRLQVGGRDVAVTSAAAKAEAGAPERPEKQYVVLLLDNATIAPADYAEIRRYLETFLDSAASPNRYFALVSWVTGMNLLQPFTTDAPRVKAALPTASAALGGGDERVMDLMGALGALAESLAVVRGRKAVVYVSGGYSYTLDAREHVDRAMDALNRANVAVHGVSSNSSWAQLFADRTGGTALHITSGLAAALGKIAEEQGAYYVLRFPPSPQQEEGCHQVRLRMSQGGLDARTGRLYCAGPKQDPLAGTAAGKELEARAAGPAAGGMKASMRLPYFYTGANQARVHVAAEVTAAGMQFRRERNRTVGELNVLGVALREDGSEAARFSDVVRLSFAKQEEAEAFAKRPAYYEKQFAVPAGSYRFLLVFSSGSAYGKAESSLEIEPWAGGGVALSAAVFGQGRRGGAGGGITAGLDPLLVEGPVALVTSGVQVTPAAVAGFPATGSAVVYAEIYAPGVSGEGVNLRVRYFAEGVEAPRLDTGDVSAAGYARLASGVIPVAFSLPLKELGAGSYRIEVRAWAGAAGATRTAAFEVR